MSVAAVRRVVSRLEPNHLPTDAELVHAIAPTGADREAAFAELVSRHGSMVLGVCRGVLADSHAAEDAFQAVFLVLARKASTIRPPGAVGGWLYGVAVRTARKAKTAAARRQRREMAAIISANPNEASRERERPENSLDRSELRAVIDAELAALPEPHRAAIVLCDLQGKTRAEAALELNRPEGTVAAWLSRGRKTLATRLARRGVSLPTAGLVAVITPSLVSAELCSAAVGNFLGRGVSESVLSLAEGVMRSLSSASTKLVAAVVAVGALLVAVATATAWHANPQPNPPVTVPVAAAPPAPVPKSEPDMKGFADHQGYIYSVSYAPDGKRFVSVGNKTAIVWDTETQKKLFTVDAEFASFSDDGKSFFYLTKDEFHIADAATGKSREKFPRGMPKLVAGGRWAAISGDGSARVEFDGVVHHLTSYPVKGAVPVLADQKDHNPTGSTIVPNHGRGGAFAPGGIERFAGLHAATTDHKEVACLTIWNATTGARVGTIFRGNKFFHPVQSFAWSPDGKEIAVGHIDGVWVYDATTLKEVRKFDKSGDAGAVAWAKDGKTLAVAVREGVGAAGDFGPGENKIVATAFAVVLLDATTGKQLRRFEGFPDNLPIASLAFRPDGKQLLCGAGFFPGDGPAGNLPQPAKDAKGLRVIPLGELPAKPAPAAWKEVDALELKGWLAGSVAYSQDGKRLYVGGTEGRVGAYDVATRKKLWEYKGDDHLAALAEDWDGKWLAVTTKDGVVFLDAATGKTGDALEEKGSEPLAVQFFPDTIAAPGVGARKVIFGNARGYFAKSWLKWPNVGTTATSTVAAGKKPADEYAVPLAVSPDGKRVVVTGPIEKETGKNVLWAWSAGSGEANKLLEGHKAIVTSAAWSKDGKLIVTGDVDGVVIVWDADTFKEKSRLSLGARVVAVAASHDGKHAAAAASRLRPNVGPGVYAEEVFVWPTANSPDKPEPISRHEAGALFSSVASLAFAPDGKSLASGFCNFDRAKKVGELVGKVRVFAVAPEKPEKPAPVGKAVTDVSFSPDGTKYVVVSGGKAEVFDAATGKLLYFIEAEAARFSADGKKLFLMAEKVLECNATTGKVVKMTDRPKTKAPWRDAVFGPDGKRVAADTGAHVGVYDVATGKEVGQLAVRLADRVSEFAPGSLVGFSPDGTHFTAKGVVIGQDGATGAAVWEVATGKRVQAFPDGAMDAVRAVAFAPAGDEFAVAYSDRVEVWYVGREPVKKNPLRKFATAGIVTALAYSKDGKRLAVGAAEWIGDPNKGVAGVDQKSVVQVFDAATGKELKRLDGFERIKDTAASKWPVSALAFAPDGKTLLAGTGYRFAEPRGGEVKLFDLTAMPDKS